MVQTPQVLGQANPAADSNNTIYTVPASTQVSVSTLTACNQGSSSAKIRVAVVPSGETLAARHWIYYDLTVPAGDTFAATMGITADAGADIIVRANSANISFGAFGIELT